MKPIVWRWLAISSLVVAAISLKGETRPQYGGTLHVMMREALLSLDPADSTQPDFVSRRNLTALLFDTLVTVDETGGIKPSLAESWEASPGKERWQFRLRPGVVYHDGTPLSPEAAAASLRLANPLWNVLTQGDTVVIECKISNPELLAELSLPRNAIVKRAPDKQLSGTGPFQIVEWQPSQHLKLAAAEDYWGGRPFLDGIEIEMARDLRDQLASLQMGKADLVEIASDQTRRMIPGRQQLTSSVPVEVLALIFEHDAGSPDEKVLRQSLALSIERRSIRNVLLQGTGEPAASILPNWISGYAFVFSSEADLPWARHLREQARKVPTWRLGYDASDSLARLIAERVALNAKDAGLSLQPTPGVNVDLRLARIPLASYDPWISLNTFASQAGIFVAATQGGPIEDVYKVEKAMLATERVIPLFHVPVTYGFATSLKHLALRLDGGWDVSNAWLENVKP